MIRSGQSITRGSRCLRTVWAVRGGERNLRSPRETPSEDAGELATLKRGAVTCWPPSFHFVLLACHESCLQ